MADTNRDENRGAQEESPGEREARERGVDRRELEKPAEGRDLPPEDAGVPRRDLDSPWMGGG